MKNSKSDEKVVDLEAAADIAIIVVVVVAVVV